MQISDDIPCHVEFHERKRIFKNFVNFLTAPGCNDTGRGETGVRTGRREEGGGREGGGMKEGGGRREKGGGREEGGREEGEERRKKNGGSRRGREEARGRRKGISIPFVQLLVLLSFYK
jgi:hypothetical protein